MRTNPFVFAIMASIVLAYFFPHLAAADRGIPMGKITVYRNFINFLFLWIKTEYRSLKNRVEELAITSACSSLAKGNVTAAIFNASISGIIGILLTPA